MSITIGITIWLVLGVAAAWLFGSVAQHGAGELRT